MRPPKRDNAPPSDSNRSRARPGWRKDRNGKGEVDAAISFYTDILGFKLEKHSAPGFALLYKGNLQLLLNRPGTGGAGQSMDDGRIPTAGGWNRFQIQVDDLADIVKKVEELRVPVSQRNDRGYQR